jgi:hypothetical protein
VDIKEAVHTLKVNNTSNRFYLNRDGNSLYCPKQPNNTVCGIWCPAFKIIPGRRVIGNTIAEVELNCFPQPVSFDIQEAPDE